MSGWRQAVGGLGIALVAAVLVGASLSLAIAENRVLIDLPPTASPTFLPEATATSAPATTVPQPTAEGVTPSPTASPTSTPSPTSTSCTPPEGWTAYLIQDGDTLTALAAQYGVTTDALSTANCLSTAVLSPGAALYVPPLPATATPTASLTPSPSPTVFVSGSATPVPCGPPAGWILYTVQSGDTLFSLAQDYYTTVFALQAANCLGNSTYIQAGSQIWVPNVSTRTPTPTKTFTPGPTSTPVPPTKTPTPTNSPTATPVPPSPTPTDTATAQPPTFTPTPPSPTPPPPTATPTDPPPPTGTPTASPTSVP